MANLLERYGVLIKSGRTFSISFIEGFNSCGYKMFLSHFLKVKVPQTSLPLTFGSACHKGLESVNYARMKNINICKKCPKSCKLGTPEQKNAMNVPVEECAVKQRMLEEFGDVFDSDFENLYIEEARIKDFVDGEEKARKELAKHKEIAINAMSHVIFIDQPIGKVLYTEGPIYGSIGEHKVMGVLDLLLNDEGKGHIIDYKTAAANSVNNFPLRQMAMYDHILASQGVNIDKLSVIFMNKKLETNRSRKPFEQTSVLSMELTKENRQICKKVIGEIAEDISNISECISNGIFMKGRNPITCSYCEMREYCRDSSKLDDYLKGL